MAKDIAVIILAAGKGVRMKSDIPKVLHPVCGRPLLEYLLDLVDSLKAKRNIAVLGYKHHEVGKFLRPGIKSVIQKKLIGTADAVKTAARLLKDFKGTVLVLYADTPLLKKETINKLLEYHISNGSDATLLTAKMNKPSGYGRVLRDEYGAISGIVEEKDADEFQKGIKEVNTGIICFNKERLFDVLRRISPDNRKKEYYLTDAVSLLYKKGYVVDGLKIDDASEAMGINSRVELSEASRIMQKRINEKLMREGITITDPGTTFINYGVKIGQDTVIYPFTVIESNVKIGRRCSIGPFIHLREGTHLEDGITAGNFLEIVRSRVSSGTFLKHLGYIGDSRIGRNVNIGAGTVVANFDGRKKNTTVIKDGAFIGCDTVLIAPVKIGKSARTGAGSVVTRNKNVGSGMTVMGVPAKPLK